MLYSSACSFFFSLSLSRAYREKKANHLLAQIVKVLRSLYAVYVDLKRRFERLQGDYGQVRESNARLFEHLQEVKLENKGLRGIAANYERVKRMFSRGRGEIHQETGRLL